MTYDQILTRLEAIEEDLATRQADYEQAAEDVHRCAREFELRMARVKRSTKAATETAKKDAALDSIAASEDDLYARYTDAEARYQAQRAAVKLLETRASIGQSLLRASTREAPQSGPGPQWSRAAA